MKDEDKQEPHGYHNLKSLYSFVRKAHRWGVVLPDSKELYRDNPHRWDRLRLEYAPFLKKRQCPRYDLNLIWLILKLEELEKHNLLFPRWRIDLQTQEGYLMSTIISNLYEDSLLKPSLSWRKRYGGRVYRPSEEKCRSWLKYIEQIIQDGVENNAVVIRTLYAEYQYYSLWIAFNSDGGSGPLVGQRIKRFELAAELADKVIYYWRNIRKEAILKHLNSLHMEGRPEQGKKITVKLRRLQRVFLEEKFGEVVAQTSPVAAFNRYYFDEPHHHPDFRYATLEEVVDNPSYEKIDPSEEYYIRDMSPDHRKWAYRKRKSEGLIKKVNKSDDCPYSEKLSKHIKEAQPQCRREAEKLQDFYGLSDKDAQSMQDILYGEVLSLVNSTERLSKGEQKLYRLLLTGLKWIRTWLADLELEYKTPTWLRVEHSDSKNMACLNCGKTLCDSSSTKNRYFCSNETDCFYFRKKRLGFENRSGNYGGRLTGELDIYRNPVRQCENCGERISPKRRFDASKCKNCTY